MPWQGRKNAPGAGATALLSGTVGMEYRRLEEVAIDRDEMRGRSGRIAARHIQRGQAIVAMSMRLARPISVPRQVPQSLLAAAKISRVQALSHTL